MHQVLLESTMLPALADLLRKELGLPVFDSTTLVDLVRRTALLPHYTAMGPHYHTATGPRRTPGPPLTTPDHP